MTRDLQGVPNIDSKAMREMIAILSKEKNGQEEVEDLFNYDNQDERLRQRLQKRIEEEMERYNRVEPEPAQIMFDNELDVTLTEAEQAAENAQELIDVTGMMKRQYRELINEPKDKSEQTPTEQIREQLGGYIDQSGAVSEEERAKHQTPVEQAKESHEQLKDVTGKLIERPDEWGIEGNKREKSEAEKGREKIGSSVDKNGVARETDANKTFPERAQERIEKLDKQMGELIDKPKELTGKENTEDMTPAEKANKALGNKLEVNPDKKKDEKTPPEAAEERVTQMVDKMGERVDKHEKITGEEIDEDMTEMEKAKMRMGNRLDVKGVVPEDDRKKSPPEEAEEQLKQMIEKMGERIEKPEQMTGQEVSEEMSETEKVRKLMGGRVDSGGVVPDEERDKKPPEIAQEEMAAMIEKMGEKIQKSEALTGQKDTEKMSEMQKAKETFGGRLDAKGIVPDEQRDKNPVEKAEEKAEALQEKQGELVNKREELTGEENREAMTETEKANADMGNYIDTKGVTTEEERDHTPVERIEERIEELDAETGRLVIDTSEIGDSRIVPMANRLQGQQQDSFLNAAKKLDKTGGPNMDKFISTTHALIEKREDEQLKNYLAGVEDQSGVALSVYLSAAAQRNLFA
ncbi:MAG: hypothetical protein OMM_02184 [Candidatus Magnetoglobus multicellularis str. Araruama]|uniref:Uncharacterized protein n=1 Tax=Candidatus Magnetoglobus multicellularis str. Araruama TaxID=890399 RepID=A0A1V1PA95_9BACT|nr:MAG: hypothetical protein OMM_02184 [Candidatus Magnetoglobus multicellularis str. Araruama]